MAPRLLSLAPLSAAPVTLKFKTGRASQLKPHIFSSAEDFAEFAKSGNVSLVSKDGFEKMAVRSLEQALSGAEGDYLRITSTPWEKIDTRMGNLEGHKENSTISHERVTTLGIASNPDFVAEFGPLTLVAEGESVTFFDHANKAVLEADGIVKNTHMLLLNDAKHTPTEDDARMLVNRTKTLVDILKNAAAYTSHPSYAIDQVAGINAVLPIISGYNFKPSVAHACRRENVRVFAPNGIDYSFRRDIHALACIKDGLKSVVRLLR